MALPPHGGVFCGSQLNVELAYRADEIPNVIRLLCAHGSRHVPYSIKKAACRSAIPSV
jgi:hypothetical protein